MTGYRMDASTPEQMAADDPFPGRGVFLPLVAPAEQIMEALDRAFGIVPAVAWPNRGAWIDPAGMDVTPAEALARWGNANAALPS